MDNTNSALGHHLITHTPCSGRATGAAVRSRKSGESLITKVDGNFSQPFNNNTSFLLQRRWEDGLIKLSSAARRERVAASHMGWDGITNNSLHRSRGALLKEAACALHTPMYIACTEQTPRAHTVDMPCRTNIHKLNGCVRNTQERERESACASQIRRLLTCESELETNNWD